jgi:O-antigen/teichoic acid export membrane protein
VNTREFLPQDLPGIAPVGSLVEAAPLPAAGQVLETGTEPVTPGLSLQSNFAWILTGNVVYAACQWGAIVALAKLGSSFMIGQFSLGLAIATPVLMSTNLHLRAVQATDARRLYSFGAYLRLRTVMTLGGLAVITGIAWFGNYERQTAMVILAVAFAKGIETLSDIHYGLFQLNDRLDQIGRSMMLRGALSVLALSTGLYLTRNVFWGCVGLALVWLSALLLFDVRRGRRFAVGSESLAPLLGQTIRGRSSRQGKGFRRQLNLMRVALPLGIAMTMATINLNMPRYFIHARLGERQLGIFSAMAYATVAMILVSDSLGHCAIPRMSRLYTGGRLAEFESLLLRLLAAGGVLGLAGLAVAQVLGVRLLTIFYGREYAVHSRIFVVLILATAIHCVACMFTSAITSARCFRIQVPLYALVAGSNALACARWVPTAGLAGGAAAMVVAAVVHLVLGAAVVGGLLWAPAKRVACPQTTESCMNDWEGRSL